MRPLLFIISYLFLSTFLCAQKFSTKGQLWSNISTNDNIKHTLQYTIGYLPTFSLEKNLKKNHFLDMEISARLVRTYHDDYIFDNSEELYRYWIRYTSEKLETRIGMQKIIFGPAQILRSLNWFDTFSIQDPTGQTEGVEAILIRYFPSNVFSIWAWGVKEKELSPGGRVEISMENGECGLTFHNDIVGSNRFSIDYRYDGFIGFWSEVAIIRTGNNKREIIDQNNLISIGVDYTAPISNGILLMMEYKRSDNVNKSIFPHYISGNNSIAFMSSIPIGIFHNIMFLSTIFSTKSRINSTNNRDHYYNLQWSSIYDQYSINLGLHHYFTESRSSISNESNFVNGISITFIYNY